MNVNQMNDRQLVHRLDKLKKLREMVSFDRGMWKHYTNKINYVKKCIKINKWREELHE